MANRTDRLEARIAPDDADKIRKAAALSGASASAFMVDAAVDRAERVLRRESETVVSAEYFDRLLAALDEPPEVMSRLQRAARQFERLATGDGDSYVIRRRADQRKARPR